MKKRLLAVLCMLIILVGVFAFNAVADTVTDTYAVGYSIKDINPWVDPTDHSKGVLNTVQLTGNGNNHERNCTGLMDDNDDGVVGEGDGLFATCTAITDTYGTTVLYINLDLIAGYDGVTAKVRETIVEALGSNVITTDKIFVNGSHTHSGPNMDALDGKEGGLDEYYDYTISQITAAAVEAYNDRAPATMKKGSIDAKESTAKKGYNGDAGYDMNAIRHYNMEIQKKFLSFITTDTKQYVSGSNFGKTGNTIGASISVGDLTGYEVTANSNAAEADNTMHVLMFDFGTASSKEPILLVNWRAHTTNNSGGDTKTKVSSDYVNSLRANLKKAGYRAAFLQGAAGNVVMHSNTKDDWNLHTGEKDSNVYGRLLAEIALDCVENNMTSALAVEKIRTMQVKFVGNKQEVSEGLMAAAEQYIAETDGTTSPAVPYVYTHTDGKKYILNSKFHASTIISRANNTNPTYLQLELNAIMLGTDVAFVTAPCEIVDRYDINGSRVDADNDWLELLSTNLLGKDTYGTPFVMGYTNGSRSYVPNALDYTYNTDEYSEITGWGADGDEFFGAGSYEANTSRFARGTGEQIIQTYKRMLQTIHERNYDAVCEACGKTVEWQPLIAEHAAANYLGTGHYYLYEDLPAGAFAQNQKMVLEGETLCLDLHGKSMSVNGRSLNIASGATLNLMDTEGNGKITSYSGGNNVGGGVATVSGTMNIYGGTLQFIRQELPEDKYETGIGGVIQCFGTVNMYDGTLIGGELVLSSYFGEENTKNGCGGTVYLYSSGQFNVSGGRVVSGQAAEGKYGDCIYLAGTSCAVTLSGDAVVDEIYINENSGTQLNIKGNFTGTTSVVFNPDKNTLNKGTDVGNILDGGTFVSNALLTPDFTRMKIVANADNLVLGELYDVITAPCRACGGSDKEWIPLTIERAGENYLGTGHYYLPEDLPAGDYAKNQKILKTGETLCLDLHGHKSEIQGRSFYVNTGSKLNVMDTVGGGQVISYSGGNNVGGGTALVDVNAVMNIYGGTFRFVRQELPAGKGNISKGTVISCCGTVNMYDGTLIGGTIQDFNLTDAETGCGGTVYVYSSGKLNLSGGEIVAGKAASGRRGDCVYLSGKNCTVTLSGAGKADEIYINENSGTQLVVSGTYTGKAKVHFNQNNNILTKGVDVGTVTENAVFDHTNLYCTSHSQFQLAASETDLVLTSWDSTVAAVVAGDDSCTTYTTLADALQNYTSGSIVLTKDVEESVAITKNVYMDLNGCDINGALTISEGKTLYCMDSQTDDYTVADGVYGTISNYTGTLAGVQESWDRVPDGYLMVTEGGKTSFHRVNLQLTAMSLRAPEVGVYYRSNFAGDEVVSRNVQTFGVALSIQGVPTEKNLDTYCWRSKFHGFISGASGNSSDAASTLLKNVLKSVNTDAINTRNASLNIYGRAYIYTTNGQYLFGKDASRTFREQVEAVNDIWSTLSDSQKAAVTNLVNTYPNVVASWDIPNILG